MATTAKDALQQAKNAMGLRWGPDNARDALTSIVDQLVHELATPASAMRTLQVLWLSPTDASSRHKPVAKRVLDKLSDPLPTLADGDHALAWAQILAWSTLCVGLDNASASNTPKFIALMRSGAEWCAADELKKRLWRDLFTKAEMACRMPTPVDFKPYEPSPDDIDSDVYATAEAIAHIETHLQQPLTAPRYLAEPLETLWWGQSLYSPSLHESYRDLNDSEKLFWMAEDMAQLPNTYPSEARTSFFTETLRRVLDEIDKPVPLEQLVRDLIQGIQDGKTRHPSGTIVGLPQALRATFDEDPTGLPITFIVEAALRKTATIEILAEVSSKVGLDITQQSTPRQWARWVCRERLLVRYLEAPVKG